MQPLPCNVLPGKQDRQQRLSCPHTVKPRLQGLLPARLYLPTADWQGLLRLQLLQMQHSCPHTVKPRLQGLLPARLNLPSGNLHAQRKSHVHVAFSLQPVERTPRAVDPSHEVPAHPAVRPDRTCDPTGLARAAACTGASHQGLKSLPVPIAVQRDAALRNGSHLAGVGPERQDRTAMALEPKWLEPKLLRR